jgi:hypothetical protein
MKNTGHRFASRNAPVLSVSNIVFAQNLFSDFDEGNLFAEAPKHHRAAAPYFYKIFFRIF